MTSHETLPDRGHNNPPEILPVLPPVKSAGELEDKVEAAKAEAAKQADPPPYDVTAHATLGNNVMAFCDACGAWKDLKEITTKEQSERLTDFVTGARGLYKKVEEQRKADKKIHDDRGKEVQKAYTSLTAKLEKVADDMKAMQAIWISKENERIAAEQAAARAEAEAKLEEARRAAAAAETRNDVSGEVDAADAIKEAEKAVKSASKAKTAKAGSATGAGRSMSLRKVYECEITNINHAFMAFRENPEVAELLTRLANAEVRSQKGEKVAPAGFKLNEKKVAA
ncbi:hypothetical protein DL1_08685 [Thioclava dalianensis]|uniref:Uncharacterized protein n=1 Tax=Thioclava dalianensis TaxID=1185766 RepID=A0A074TFB7_9RHOB|nr:hypothetical protein [Thioclava dalianensis]KEP68835.1 hypothetical protein DL1_08685 [Thioclava dalianensis]SFN49188.1 hypothetical protein SAMN05216224_10652 [Thioclava dalianensis]